MGWEQWLVQDRAIAIGLQQLQEIEAYSIVIPSATRIAGSILTYVCFDMVAQFSSFGLAIL